MVEISKFSNTQISTPYKSLADTERSRSFLKQLFKSCKKGDTVIYTLSIDSVEMGLIALSASKIEHISAVQVDYIFVQKEFRKKELEQIGGVRVSQYLLAHALKVADTIKSEIGLRWLILTPDNDTLQAYYQREFGFTKYKNAMFLAL